jgi:mutator protein MutT
MNTHPSHALKHCPFCGSSRFCWDGTKAHLCEDCHHTFYTNAAGATIALIKNDKGELLFTVRRSDPAKGMLDLPGGFIDLGETAEACVCREVQEELNIAVTDLHFFGTFPNTYQYGGLTYFTIDIVFECAVDSFASLKAGDDVTDCRFIPLEKVNLNDVGLHSVKEVIRAYKSSLSERIKGLCPNV